MKKKIIICLVIISLIPIFLSGCIVNNVEEPEEVEFVITKFEVSPGEISSGETAYLTWSVTGADTVEISGIGNVALSGNQIINPSETTTYTITATNELKSITATTIIIVELSDTINANDPINIEIFQISPDEIFIGESTSLTWSVTGADTVFIDNDIGYVELSGSKIINPSESTTYKLTASKTTTSITTSSSEYRSIIVENLPVITPTFKLTKSESNDRLEVQSADSSADWNRLNIYLKTSPTSTPIIVGLNTEAVAGGISVGVGVANAVSLTSSANPMGVGEYIDFEAAGGIETDVTVVIVDTVSNTKIGEWTFLSIAELE